MVSYLQPLDVDGLGQRTDGTQELFGRSSIQALFEMENCELNFTEGALRHGLRARSDGQGRWCTWPAWHFGET